MITEKGVVKLLNTSNEKYYLSIHHEITPSKSVELTVAEGENTLQNLISLDKTDKLVGKKVKHLFPRDRQMIDSWIEFLLKIYFEPENAICDHEDVLLAFSKRHRQMDSNKFYC